MDDHEVARMLVHRIGRDLLRLHGDVAAGGRATVGVQLARARMLEEIGRVRPNDRVLFEQTRHDPRRLACERVWIIDPLNGVEEYSRSPAVDWGVHVALWRRDRLAAGAIALPTRGLVFGTASDSTSEVATLDSTKSVRPRRTTRGIRVAVREHDAPELLTSMTEEMGVRPIPSHPMGAALRAVLLGEAEAYIDLIGADEWISAGPVAIALAAGIHASRIDGSPLAYNAPDAVLPDLVMCRRGARDDLLAAVRSKRPTGPPSTTHTSRRGP